MLKLLMKYRGLGEVGAAGVVQCLNIIAAGTDYDERINRSIEAEYIDLTVACTPPADAVYDAGRVLVVWDSASLGAVATISEILDSAVIAPLYLEPINLTVMANRFTVLLDHRFPFMRGLTGDSTYNTSLSRRIKIPKKCKRCLYGTTASDEPTQGALLIVLCGYNNSATANNNIVMTYSSVLRFKDVY
jgi:hypothetical protein